MTFSAEDSRSQHTSNSSESTFRHPQTPPRNEDHAKEALMSIPDGFDGKDREGNTSAISSWSPNAAHSILLQRLPTHPDNKKAKGRLGKLEQQRKSVSENSFMYHGCCQLSMAVNLKRELNKLRVPMKEKLLNSQQFIADPFAKEKGQLTRSKIRCDVINSKPEIMPTQPSRRKARTENTYDNILKERALQPYQRIKRTLLLPEPNHHELYQMK